MKAAKKFRQIRRKSWPEHNYIMLNSPTDKVSTVKYWDNDKFGWEEIILTLEDLVALDWVEDK